MATQEAHKNNLIVGEGVLITGKVEAAGEMLVHGTIEGEVKADTIRVGANGRIEGALLANHVEVHGFIGDTVQANERLTVRSSATVVGSIQYKSIEIESGAKVSATLQQISQS